MTDFCDGKDDLSGLRCSVFVTFVLTHAALFMLGVILYSYHRWQENLEKRLLIADYNHKNNRESGRSSAGNKGKQAGLLQEGLLIQNQPTLEDTKSQISPADNPEKLGLLMKSLGRSTITDGEGRVDSMMMLDARKMSQLGKINPSTISSQQNHHQSANNPQIEDLAVQRGSYSDVQK